MIVRIEHVRFTEAPKAKKERLRFATECRLLAADGATLGSLSNRFTLIALTNAWLLVWDADFHSGNADLIFGDQEEMGFGARVATAITEKNGGVITSSSGLKTAKNTWGQPDEWCDYSGTVDNQRVGIVLMADSERRTRWTAPPPSPRKVNPPAQCPIPPRSWRGELQAPRAAFMNQLCCSTSPDVGLGDRGATR